MMAVHNVIISFVISMFLLPGLSSGGTMTEYNNLYNTYLKGYNKDCRPVQDQSTVTNASLYFYLESIADLDEVSSKLVTVGLFTIRWKDETIKWNESDYENTTLLYIDESLDGSS